MDCADLYVRRDRAVARAAAHGAARVTISPSDLSSECLAAGDGASCIVVVASGKYWIAAQLGGFGVHNFFLALPVGAGGEIAQECEVVGGFDYFAVCAAGDFGELQWEVVYD